MNHLIDLLITWIETPDWAASEAFLRLHESELLTEEAEKVLAVFQRSNPGDMAVLQHIDLLSDCRTHGIEEAYLERTSGDDGGIDLMQADQMLLLALMNAANPDEIAILIDQLPDGAPEKMVRATEAYLLTVEDAYELAAMQERLDVLKGLLADLK